MLCKLTQFVLLSLLTKFVTVICLDPVVETTHGKVSGKVFKTLLKGSEYFAFMGIPYAAPPIGALRFLPPQPIDPWVDVVRAVKEKPLCIQYNNNVKKTHSHGIIGVEDCLFIDVFTPGIDDGKRPAIVFIQNDHFKYSNNVTDYGPDFFMEENAIIATITHRLSVFGFLSLDDEILSGNAGLKDIVSGLEWLKNNVHKFGGDPNKIALMGSQGGAVASDLLIHSKASKLFNSVILQGDTSLSAMYLQDDARTRSFTLAELLERRSSNLTRLLKDLNAISSEDLLANELQAVPEDYSRYHQRSMLPFGPIVENGKGLITGLPETARRIDIPVMIGFNSREGLERSLQYLLEPKYLSYVEKDFVLLMPRRLNFTFDPNDASYFDAVKEIKSFYFPKGKVTIRNISEYITYMSDVFNFAIDYAAKFYAKISSSDVFYYHFDYYSDLNENKNDIMKLSTVEVGTFGAAAGDELCYLFKCPKLNKNYLKHNQNASKEIILLKKLVRMWVNFANYGDPTPEKDDTLEGLKWPRYNTESKLYLHVDREIEVRRDLYEKRFGFWENFIKKWERRAVDGVVATYATNKRTDL